MKLRLLATVLVMAFLSIGMTLPAFAQADELIDGLVTKVDVSAGKITIRHGPLKKFDMNDGMTMVFRAGDAAMLTAVKAGDRVKFVPERINGQFTVTKIQKMK